MKRKKMKVSKYYNIINIGNRLLESR